MNFSNTTTKDGFIQTCEQDCDLGDGNISGNSVYLKEFTNRINQAYNRVVTWILEAQSQWEWDDTANTDFPIATADLVDGQQDMALPGATNTSSFNTFLKLIRIEIADNAGIYRELLNFDEQNADGIALSELLKTNGMPVYYRETATSFEMYPKPAAANVTLTAGARVYFQRTPVQFLSTDTTATAGIPLPFHELIAKIASYSWLKSKKVFDLASEIKKEIYGDPNTLDEPGLKHALQAYYATRNQNVRQRMQPRSRRTRYD